MRDKEYEEFEILIPEELYWELERLAERKKCSIEELISCILQEMLSKEGKGEEFLRLPVLHD